MSYLDEINQNCLATYPSVETATLFFLILVSTIIGPTSLAEQIGPEYGCSLLLLVPLLQLDTSFHLVHTPPRSRPLSLHGHSTWARITACGRWRWLVPSLSLHSTWARRPVGPLPHARTGRHTAGLSWRGSIRWSIPIYSKPQ